MSEESHRAFEKWAKNKSVGWPEDHGYMMIQAAWQAGMQHAYRESVKVCRQRTEAYARQRGGVMGQMCGLGEGSATDCAEAIERKAAE